MHMMIHTVILLFCVHLWLKSHVSKELLSFEKGSTSRTQNCPSERHESQYLCTFKTHIMDEDVQICRDDHCTSHKGTNPKYQFLARTRKWVFVSLPVDKQGLLQIDQAPLFLYGLMTSLLHPLLFSVKMRLVQISVFSTKAIKSRNSLGATETDSFETTQLENTLIDWCKGENARSRYPLFMIKERN